MKALGAATIEDPFAGSVFARLAKKDIEFDDRGIELIAYDMRLFLRRLGPSVAIRSFAELEAKTKIPEDPFESEEVLGKR